MKIDVVIGNPPYQKLTSNDNSYAMPIFDKFILSGLKITSRCLSLITPTKWMTGTLPNWVELRKQLTVGNHIVSMIDYMGFTTIFPGTLIAGGVSYFLYDKEYTGKVKFTTISKQRRTDLREFPTTGVIPRHYIGETVISKIKKLNEETIDKVVFKDRWKLPTNYTSHIVNPVNPDDIKIITPSGNYYIPKEKYYSDELIDTYKIKFTRVADIHEHDSEDSSEISYKVLILPEVINPGEICNASYMTICGIKEKHLAKNIESYLRTRLVRFIIYQTLFGMNLTCDRFNNVPIQDFTKQWTDKELYEKYDITPDEQRYIEQLICPL
jgi:site-specific DNA-methyltransferase (adenine-specific)